MARTFDLIENPEPGWVTRRIERHARLGNDPVWQVELARKTDGVTVFHEHESLHVAWVRACEQANYTERGLGHDDH